MGEPAASLRPSGYAQVRAGFRELVEPGVLGRPVPACPGWTAGDLLAHVVELAEAAVTRHGGAVGAGGDLLDHWDELGAYLDPLLAEDPRGVILLMDAYTHELDLRAALGAEPPSGHPAEPGSLTLLVRGFSARVAELGLPALRVLTTGGRTWVAGSGPVTATVAAAPYSLYRSLAGRRSEGQIAELVWSADPGPWLAAFTWGPFQPPAEAGE